MSTPKRRKMTAVERLIVIAIVGVLFSIIMPNLQRMQRRPPPRRARVTAPARRSTQEPAGQLNTVQVPLAARDTKRSSPEAVGRSVGAAARLALILAAVGVFIAALRQRFKSARQ